MSATLLFQASRAQQLVADVPSNSRATSETDILGACFTIGPTPTARRARTRRSILKRTPPIVPLVEPSTLSGFVCEDVILEMLMKFVCTTPNLTTDLHGQRLWMQTLGRAGQVCKPWRSAVQDVWSQLDRLGQDEEAWKCRGLSIERFWLWQLERHRRDLQLRAEVAKSSKRAESDAPAAAAKEA